ncbi:hypothetical protein FQZ97_1102830 [compost metagenome]
MALELELQPKAATVAGGLLKLDRFVHTKPDPTYLGLQLLAVRCSIELGVLDLATITPRIPIRLCLTLLCQTNMWVLPGVLFGHREALT